MIIEIYVDGCALGNPGKGGYGAVLVAKDEAGAIIKRRDISGHIPHCTNNYAELKAAVEGIRALKPGGYAITVYSDSLYVVNGGNGLWNVSSNLDLWVELEQVIGDAYQVTFTHIKGHSGNPHNERAHTLANWAANGRVMQTGGQP